MEEDRVPISALVDLVSIIRVTREARETDADEDAEAPEQDPNVIEQRFSNLLDQFREYGNARPIKAIVSESSRFMSHPIENGEVITDHRVVLPVTISIAVILRPLFYRRTYNLIRNDYRNAQQFTIRTKTHTYRNMYLREIPHEEDVTKFDTITMVLEFVEVQFFTVEESALMRTQVQAANDASTQERGEQTNRETTLAADALDALTEFLGDRP